MTTARERLDAAQARSDAATDGPWRVEADRAHIVYDSLASAIPVAVATANGASSSFIAAARSDVPAMVAALRAVLDPETVEAMYAVLGEFDPPSYNDLLGRELATITHAAVVARIDAALGTVTP